MITITLLLFGRFAEAAGAPRMEFKLPERNAIATLRLILKERWPALAGLLEQSRFAVNDEFVEDDRPLREGDQAAIIPPVSGGSGSES